MTVPKSRENDNDSVDSETEMKGNKNINEKVLISNQVKEKQCSVPKMHILKLTQKSLIHEETDKSNNNCIQIHRKAKGQIYGNKALSNTELEKAENMWVLHVQ